MPDNFQEEEPDMTLSEKLAHEEKIIDEAFNNSFLILTNRKQFEDLLPLPHDKEKKLAVTAHNPGEEVPLESLENMIYYYEEVEEYERCAELLELKIKLFDDV